jgi:uncharacterized protein YqfB (UPF0267 family)
VPSELLIANLYKRSFMRKGRNQTKEILSKDISINIPQVHTIHFESLSEKTTSQKGLRNIFKLIITNIYHPSHKLMTYITQCHFISTNYLNLNIHQPQITHWPT